MPHGQASSAHHGQARPPMPTLWDEERALQQAEAILILTGDWRVLQFNWQLARVGKERTRALGMPNTSVNTLSNMSRQFSTPGLYGVRPTFRHADSDAANALIEPNGMLDDAGWPTKMQVVQYLTLGAGDMLARFDVSRRTNKMTCRLVMPFNVYIRADPTDPTRTLELWELHLLWFPLEEMWRFVWEVFDIRDPENPSHRFHKAEGRTASDGTGKKVGFLGDDVTGRFTEPDADPYPWKLIDGSPIIPYPHWQEVDSGQTWNHMWRFGAFIGTLEVALLWTYANSAALNASDKYVITANLEPSGVQTTAAGRTRIHGGGTLDESFGSAGDGMKFKVITPGAVDNYKVPSGTLPYLWQIEEGAILGELRNHAREAEMAEFIRWGGNPSDVTRQAANPTSAAALMVQDDKKEQFSRQVEPVFRRNDLEAVVVAAVVARAGGLGTFPEDGYSVQYPAVRPTATQMKAERDDRDAKRKNKTMSRVDLYQAENPGTSEEDALEALAKIARQDSEIARRTAELEAAALGPGAEKAQDTALNGAQVQAAGDIIARLVR